MDDFNKICYNICIEMIVIWLFALKSIKLNNMEMMPRDFNTENIAQKHQKNEFEGGEMTRRSFLKGTVEAAVASLFAGGIAKGMMKLGDAYKNHAENEKENLRKENPVASEIEDKLDLIAGGLDKIKDRISVSPVNAGFEHVSEKFPDLKDEFKFLKNEGKKFRDGQDAMPADLIFSRLEKLENDVLIEVLKVEHKG